MAKLLRKDVLKWIRNLKSGRYLKNQRLLVSESGNKFCCLGVWADQHGCSWEERISGQLLRPIAKGRVNAALGQEFGSLGSDLSYGLTIDMQNQLIQLNDNSRGWTKVIDYIKKEILPLAK